MSTWKINNNGGVYISNNEVFIIKCKIDSDLNTGFKRILDANNLTQQDVLEKLIKEYVISNLTLLLKSGKDNKWWKMKE